MTVYVDDIHKYDSGPWCHMWCDGEINELHRMAAAIGLKRDWFQQKDPRFLHYDLRPTKREAALRTGAKYMPLRQWIASGLPKRMQNSREIQCPNCTATAKLIKVVRDGSVFRCSTCQVITVKKSDQPYTD
ncbi:MAG: DUF4031 domain-containing protein [Anaerolineae bacterium]|nr:DUF4031 domain-containing protein [Anaerolineae bacterium]